MFPRILARIKIFRRSSKIFRDLERYSKVKDLFEDLDKIFQRYCKDTYFLPEMSKLKAYKNLLKIFMKIFENLVSLKIKGLQRSS